MEIVVERVELLEGMKAVGHTVGGGIHLYDKVLLDAEGPRPLCLRTANGVGGIRVEVPAKVDMRGAVVVEHRLLLDWLKAVHGDIIKMRLEEEGLRCQCGRQWMRMKNPTVKEDFMTWPQLGEPIVEMDIHDIAQAVEAVVWATDAERVALEGVLWQFGEDTITLWAADGYAASEYKVDVRALRAFEDAQALVYPEVMKALQKVADSAVKVAVGVGHVGFAFDGGEMYSRTIDASFPHLDSIIQSAMNGMAWEAKRIGLVGLVDLAAIFAQASVTGASWIQFTWIPGDPSSVRAIAQDVSTGDFEGSIDVELGEGEEIAFNVSGKLLLSALKSMSGAKVLFHFRDAAKAIGIEDGRHRVAIMPMHVA